MNRAPAAATTSTLEQCLGGWNWRPAAHVRYRVEGCEMMLAIPRAALGADRAQLISAQ